MEDICSYGDCPGSPKNSCSCDRSLKYCEYHMTKHLEIPGNHSMRPLIKLEDQPTSSLLAVEMKTLSSTMSKVMLTGKQMFEEICKKLCEITGELTLRQDKLIEMASNLSQAENLPQESFKDLGDLKLKFKSPEDFKKVVDDHFSNDTASVDFSLFSDDIKNIMSHLNRSNLLLEEVRSQSQLDKESREEMKNRLNSVENFTLQIEQNLKNEIKEIDFETREREKRFTLNEKTEALVDRVQILEHLVESQNNAIQEVNCKYSSTVDGLAAQAELYNSQDEKMKKFSQNAENQFTLQYEQLNLLVEQKIAEINQTLESTSKILGENAHKNREDLRQQCDYKIDGLNQSFNLFCDRIRDEVQGLTQEYQGHINRFDHEFQVNIRKEIDQYKQFKKDELRIKEENERIEKERIEKEEKERLEKEEKERLEKEEKERIEKLQAERKNIGLK